MIFALALWLCLAPIFAAGAYAVGLMLCLAHAMEDMDACRP